MADGGIGVHLAVMRCGHGDGRVHLRIGDDADVLPVTLRFGYCRKDPCAARHRARKPDQHSVSRVLHLSVLRNALKRGISRSELRSLSCSTQMRFAMPGSTARSSRSIALSTYSPPSCAYMQPTL